MSAGTVILFAAGWGIAALLIGMTMIRERRMLARLSRMLTQAAEGDYSETDYDETMLSQVEAKMVRFLNSSILSARKVKEERDRIQKLLSDISHQTKTPISNILLFAELLEEMELSKEGQIAVKALKGQAEKLRFLIQALVKMSRLEQGVVKVSPKKNPLDPMLEDVSEQIRPKAKEKDVAVEVKAGELWAVFDRKWTEEALYNLADNAVKYTPKGGNVSISARAFEMFVRIDVKDSGIGIAEEEQSRIFSRFYRSGDAQDQEGVGVGLFLAREIVSREGGYIRVESAKGKGSLFSIYLPRETYKSCSDASRQEMSGEKRGTKKEKEVRIFDGKEWKMTGMLKQKGKDL